MLPTEERNKLHTSVRILYACACNMVNKEMARLLRTNGDIIFEVWPHPTRNASQIRGITVIFSIQPVVQGQFGIGKYDEWSRPTRRSPRQGNYGDLVRITRKRAVFLKFRMESAVETAADDGPLFPSSNALLKIRKNRLFRRFHKRSHFLYLTYTVKYQVSVLINHRTFVLIWKNTPSFRDTSHKKKVASNVKQATECSLIQHSSLPKNNHRLCTARMLMDPPNSSSFDSLTFPTHPSRITRAHAYRRSRRERDSSSFPDETESHQNGREYVGHWFPRPQTCSSYRHQACYQAFPGSTRITRRIRA